jgi:hypothetical protein
MPQTSNISTLYSAGLDSSARKNYYPAVQLLDNQNNEITPLVDVHSIYDSGDGTVAPPKDQLNIFYKLNPVKKSLGELTSDSSVVLVVEDTTDDNTLNIHHAKISEVFSAFYNTGIKVYGGINTNAFTGTLPALNDTSDGTTFLSADLLNPGTYNPLKVKPSNSYLWMAIPKTHKNNFTVMGYSNGDFPQVIDGSIVSESLSNSEYFLWVSKDKFGINAYEYNLIVGPKI